MKLRRRRPINMRAAKWAGVSVTALLVVLWVGSAVYYCGYFSSGRIYGLYNGEIVFSYHVNMSAPKYDGLHVGPRVDKDPWDWWFQFQTTYARGRVLIPLWPFVLASLSITAACWRMDALRRCQSTGPAALTPSANAPSLVRYLLPACFVVFGAVLALTGNRHSFNILAMASVPTFLLMFVIPLPFTLGVLILGAFQYFLVGYGIDRLIGRLRNAKLATATEAARVCANCGYSLHGLEGTQCPECGMPLAP